jgi:hypothetical protein
MTPVQELPRGVNRGLRFHVAVDGKVASWDVFEYHWGPFAQGRMSLPGIVKWFLARTFPRAEQLSAIPPAKGFLDALILIAYAAIILALLAGSVKAALGVVAPGGADTSLRSLLSVSLADSAGRLRWALDAGISFWIGFALLAYSLWQVLLRIVAILGFLLRRGPDPLPVKDECGNRTKAAALRAPERAKTLLGNLLWLLVWLFIYQVARLQIAATAAVSQLNLLLMLLLFVAFREILKSYFINFIGDIPVYVSRNEYAESYSVRRKIIDTGSDLLRELLGVPKDDAGDITIKLQAGENREQKTASENPGYAQVIVAGHSLGSVIGLDILRQTCLRLTGNERWDRLTHFITFGSPLRKISYLTLQEEGDPDRLRMDGFTKTLRPVFRKGQANEVAWWNFVIPTDPVADDLNGAGSYGGIPKDIHVPRIGEPLTSHSRYWSEPALYEWICTALGI